jgi:uncharacterized protein YjiK
MLVPSRAIALGVMLATIPQAQRTALGRCTIGERPAASYHLPGRLVEVSGLAIGPRGTLLTHGDERGVVTVLDGRTLQLVREITLRGTPKDDFEGIAAAGDSIALMTSSGKVYLFRFGADSSVPFTTIETGLGRHCELEGLAWQRAQATLLLPCKQARGQAATGLTVYRYRLGSKPGPVAPIHVNGAALAQMTGVALLRATSIEIDSPTGHLVALSSKPPLVLEIDTTGRPLAARHLSSRSHPQAEGLTITADAIWIADEGAGRKGTLTRYACR